MSNHVPVTESTCTAHKHGLTFAILSKTGPVATPKASFLPNRAVQRAASTDAHIPSRCRPGALVIDHTWPLGTRDAASVTEKMNSQVVGELNELTQK